MCLKRIIAFHLFFLIGCSSFKLLYSHKKGLSNPLKSFFSLHKIKSVLLYFFYGENLMQLGEWIRRNGYNYRTFGEEIGVSFRNIEKWSRGETLPRFNKAKLIFDFTNNEVTGHDFYEKQIQRHQTNLQG